MASSAIDQLRILLDHFDGSERAQQLEFFRAILSAGPEGIVELDGRLPGARAPRALRQLALESSYYFPWPEWVPVLGRVLRYEPDFPIFETGTRALGRVGNTAALNALRELIGVRQGAEFKEVIAGVLSETDPAEAFSHHMSRLLEGSGNPGVANEAAQRLAHLVDGNSLEPLLAVVMHPDLLVFRHGLQLVAKIPTAEAAQALLEILQENHAEMLADRSLKEALASLRSATPAAAREQAEAGLLALSAKGVSHGSLRSFFQQVASASADGKQGQLQTLLTQASEAVHLRSRRLGFAVDAAAEGLAAMVARGLVAPEPVLDLLVPAYREQCGREGVARALAALVPAEASDLHELILAGPDGTQRGAAVEVLGERREEALEPVLLLACRDPLTDIAERALHHLGQLPGAERLAHRLLHSSVPEDLRLGLRLVGEHRFQALVPDLLELMKNATREELALLAIEALGAVGAAQAAQPLLEILHSGQSPRLQLALAQALRGIRQPEVALALCDKADELRTVSLHVLAVEAVAETFGDGQPLPAAEGPKLVDQVLAAWTDRNPWSTRLRLVVALQGLRMEHGESWRALAELVHEALAEKRPPGAWNADELHLVQAAGRDFARRVRP